jgi:hypothetical protein
MTTGPFLFPPAGQHAIEFGDVFAIIRNDRPCCVVQLINRYAEGKAVASRMTGE